MSNKIKVTIALGLAVASGALAQDTPPPMAPHRGMAMGGEFGGPGMAGMGPWGKVVTGAPYSADVTSQSVQSLPDGNTISRNTTGHVARDSQGRTYTQETITGGFVGANGPVTVTFISDPVAGYSYVLNSGTKVATRMQKHSPPQDGTAHKGRDRTPGSAAGMGPMGRDASNTQTSDLGTQTIGGVVAQGKSITHTIPAGAMGNSMPIVSTGETWYSADLQTIVLAKHTDPRMGQSTFALQNIQRAEPAATLFQVPSDYTVKDGRAGAPARMGFGGHRAPPPAQ